MAGQKSGKAPGQTPYAPGGAEVWSDSDHDYFKDTLFNREGSLNQIRQRDQDVDRLYKEKDAARRSNNAATVDSINEASEKAKQYTPSTGYAKGGQVGKIGTFGMKRSKPDFAAGGGMINRKSWSK